MRNPRAFAATSRARRAQNRPGGKALRHRRRAGIERGAGPRAPLAAETGEGGLDCSDPHSERRRLSLDLERRMMRGRLRSLQVRLALRLAALYVAGTAVAIGVLIYQAYDTAGSLYDRELSQRAEDLSKAVSRDSAGAPRVELSQQLASAYVNSDADIFAVRDSSGRILGASPPE